MTYALASASLTKIMLVYRRRCWSQHRRRRSNDSHPGFESESCGTRHRSSRMEFQIICIDCTLEVSMVVVTKIAVMVKLNRCLSVMFMKNSTKNL